MCDFSDALCVDLIIIGMGTDMSDKNDGCVVVDFHNEAVRVSLDVEDDAIAGEDIGRGIAQPDVCWRFPLCSNSFMKPRLQGGLGIRMFFIKVAEGFSGDDSHGKGNSASVQVKHIVPVLGTCIRSLCLSSAESCIWRMYYERCAFSMREITSDRLSLVMKRMLSVLFMAWSSEEQQDNSEDGVKKGKASPLSSEPIPRRPTDCVLIASSSPHYCKGKIRLYHLRLPSATECQSL